SRRLARRLGGDISVTSVYGEGSRFRLEVAAVMGIAAPRSSRSLPIRSSPSTTSPAAHPRAVLAGDDLRSLEGVRVLLAEDGPDNRQLIAYVLRKAGIE